MGIALFPFRIELRRPDFHGPIPVFLPQFKPVLGKQTSMCRPTDNEQLPATVCTTTLAIKYRSLGGIPSDQYGADNPENMIIITGTKSTKVNAPLFPLQERGRRK